MKSLFEGEKIGNINLKNRFVRSGTWMRKATDEGFLTEELYAKYEKLSTAELGLVICGYARVDSCEQANNKMIGLYDDKFIPGLRKFTSMFHENGTPVGIQIAMGGTQIHYQGDIDWDIMAVSETIVKMRGKDGQKFELKVPEMTLEDIKKTQADFVQAARRAKESGFDLIQLHAAHGYFLSQWINPNINKRKDEYGTNREKYLIELYEKIRAELGADFPIGIKINSEEKIGDSSNFDLMFNLCVKLDKLGIDLIEVSGFAPSRTNVKNDAESYFLEFATKLKTLVGCKVMLTGGNKTYSNLEKIIQETNIELIGLSRTLISEPGLIKMWQNDTNYKPRCVSCNNCHRDVYTCIFE